MKGEGRFGIDPVDQFSPERAKPRIGIPAPYRGVINQSVTNRRPARDLRHVRFQRGFVNKHEPFKMVAHERLAAVDPDR